MIEQLKRLFHLGDYVSTRTLGASRSGLWPHVRDQFLKDNPTCSVCNTTKDLAVHHQVPFSRDKSLELNVNNLITLCTVHHFWQGHLGSWRSFNSNVVIDARILHDKIKTRP